MGYIKLPEIELTSVSYRVSDGVATITIERPDAYNAYSTRALLELAASFREAAFDDGVGVIVYTGSGQRAFCTGGDVKEYSDVYTRSPHEYWKYMGLFSAYIESILNTGKPVVARLNGMAVGGGNESQLACDLSVMAEHAYISQVGTSVGSVAAGGATQWLPLVIGDRRARWMLMLNEHIPAHQALEWGLVNKVVPSIRRGEEWVERATAEEIAKAQRGEDDYRVDLARLDEAVAKLCRDLLEKFPECMRYTKQQTNFWKDLVWHQTVGHARDWLSLHFGAVEPNEGMGAFVEKRTPDYAGLRARAAAGGVPELPWGPPVRRCPTCGAQNLPEGFSFCGSCGVALSENKA